MTHHITPPPELVQQWFAAWESSDNEEMSFAEFAIPSAAQWGADTELEACCEWLASLPNNWTSTALKRVSDLRAARRPKPQTLNSVALQMLGTIERDAHYLPEITDTIRRALAQPEPQRPTDEELLDLGNDLMGDCLPCDPDLLIAFARAVLARWGAHD